MCWSDVTDLRLPPVRYRGLARNATTMWFMLLAYNLRRADRLLAGTTPLP